MGQGLYFYKESECGNYEIFDREGRLIGKTSSEDFAHDFCFQMNVVPVLDGRVT